MIKIPNNITIKSANFIINYLEILYKDFYNIQHDLLNLRNITEKEKIHMIYKRAIINDNINTGYLILYRDIFNNKISNKCIYEYVKSKSTIINTYNNTNLLCKYNYDNKTLANKIMLNQNKNEY